VKNSILAFALTAIVCLWAREAHSQTQAQKIGFVMSSKIFKELPEAQDALKRLEALTKPVQDSLAAMQRALEEKFEEYQKKEAMMTDAAKRAAQQEFSELQRRARDYAEEKDNELSKQKERILTPLNEKIIAAIERVAKEEKYSFIFDKTDPVNVLLYGDAAHDLTFKVIDKLKRGK
jgi:outer membrane protein